MTICKNQVEREEIQIKEDKDATVIELKYALNSSNITPDMKKLVLSKSCRPWTDRTFQPVCMQYIASETKQEGHDGPESFP